MVQENHADASADENEPRIVPDLSRDSVGKMATEATQPLKLRKLSFEAALKRFVTSTTLAKQYARLCSEKAIMHFSEHGDTAYIQRFYDECGRAGKNFIRRQAFVTWAAAFSPLTMQANRFKKDTSEGAIEFNLEGALSKPFWDFSPDPEDIVWEAPELFKALKSVVNKFANDRHIAKGGNARAMHEAAERMLEKLATYSKKEEATLTADEPTTTEPVASAQPAQTVAAS